MGRVILVRRSGVDFALHYLHAYRRERAAGRSHQETVAATLATAGRGLRWNALVLACGFAVLTVSAIQPNARLGLLLAAAMLASYGTTVVILPELLRRFGTGLKSGGVKRGSGAAAPSAESTCATDL